MSSVKFVDSEAPVMDVSKSGNSIRLKVPLLGRTGKGTMGVGDMRCAQDDD